MYEKRGSLTTTPFFVANLAIFASLAGEKKYF